MSDSPTVPPEDDEVDAFLRSLDDGLARVVDAARGQAQNPDAVDRDLSFTLDGKAATPKAMATATSPAPPPAPAPAPAPTLVPRPGPTPVAVNPQPTPTPAVADVPEPSFDDTAPWTADVADLDEPSASHRATAARPRRRLALAGVGALVVVIAGLTGAWLLRDDRAPTSPTAHADLDALPPTAAGPASTVPAAAAPTPVAPPPAAGPALARAAPAPAAPGPAHPAAAPTRLSVVSDADASTEVRMLAELTQAVDGAGVELAPASAASASASAAAASPSVAIVRYDALQAAPTRWRAVAPLHVELVYALVRADSPLRGLNELRGRRIDIGPPGSARAVSATALYRRMFGSAPVSTPATTLPPTAAVQRLLESDDLDAVIVFDGQPSGWLAALPAASRDRLRLLRLAPETGSGQRALQSYLSVSVPALPADESQAAVPSLGVVAFLAAPAQAPGLGSLVRAMCAQLPSLRRSGDPAWHDVQPALRLPGQSPPTYEVSAALQACAPPPSTQPTPGV